MQYTFPRDLTDAIIAYEDGDMRHDEVLSLFQYLIDSGLAWTLQGSYGRTAHALLQAHEIEATTPVAQRLSQT